MSRKKVKKEVVKRKTNIYDPMGVYGRGLTENQRLGMTRQMKVENMVIPKPVITRELLGEYGKILEFYGMYPVNPTGVNIEIKILEVALTGVSVTVNNDYILSRLESEGIRPGVFICDSFAIEKDHSIDFWDKDMRYHINVGNSVYGPLPVQKLAEASYKNDIIPVPAYWMNDEAIHYFAIYYDKFGGKGGVEQKYENMSNQAAYADFVDNLPQDGREIPYLLYPNNDLPELMFGINTNNPYVQDGYKLQVKLVVMY